MFHPLRSLFQRGVFTWEEADIRQYVQRYLQEHLRSEEVYCERARHGGVAVRVASAAMRQAALLLEFELARDLQRDTEFILERFEVQVSV